jgi:hypothetical protein
MTNVQSMFGAGAWALVAALLLLATFEPVEQGSPALAKADTAEQSAAA